jgi:hypothetical protein
MPFWNDFPATFWPQILFGNRFADAILFIKRTLLKQQILPFSRILFCTPNAEGTASPRESLPDSKIF